MSLIVLKLTDPCAIAPITNTTGSSLGTRSWTLTNFSVWNDVPDGENVNRINLQTLRNTIDGLTVIQTNYKTSSLVNIISIIMIE